MGSGCNGVVAAREELTDYLPGRLVGETSDIKGEPALSLIKQERERRPGIWVFWMPWFLIKFMSGTAWLLQKVLRPGKTAIVVSSAFAAPRYDTKRIAEVMGRLKRKS